MDVSPSSLRPSCYLHLGLDLHLNPVTLSVFGVYSESWSSYIASHNFEKRIYLPWVERKELGNGRVVVALPI